MAKIKATHRLRNAHRVFYDPACHFGIKDMVQGARVTLPTGTHVIPTEGSLAAHPDRFESLLAPESPAEVEVDDDEEDEGVEDESDEVADDEDTDNDDADEAVDEALAEVNGEWDALTSAQLSTLADGYEISDIEGSGSGGNVLKADWIEAVQGARGATE